MGDGVIVTDPAGRVRFLNPAAQCLTGWTQDEAAGQRLEQVFPVLHQETRGPVENPAARALRAGSVVGPGGQAVLVAKDGTERRIEDRAARIKDGQGQLGGAILVFRDVSGRSRTEQAVEESEERLRLALEAGRMGTWEWDIPTGRVLWSPGLEASHGLAP